MEEYRALESGTQRTSTVDGSFGSPTPAVGTSTDLDAFLTGVYRYYCEKGLRAVLYRSVSNLIASVFTFMLSVVLLLLIDWGAVARCTSEETCRGLSLFYPDPIQPLSVYRFIVLCQLVPLGLYTVVLASLSSVAKMREAIRVSTFYKAGLGIQDDAMLTFMSWEDVVVKICDYQRSAESPLCIVQESLSPLEVTNIVMRTDNLLLQVLKKYYSRFGESSEIMRIPLQSPAIQWVIQFGLLSWLFSDRFRFRPEAMSRDVLRYRCRLIGLISLALIGPIAIFTSILLFIKETDDVRSNRSALFDKDWTALSRVVLRHFSEFDHQFEQRLSAARDKAETFSALIITDKTKIVILRSVKFIAGGLVAVLAILAVVQDSALLYFPVFGRNLFWYFAILSGAVAFSVGVSRSSGFVGKRQDLVKDKIRTSIDLVSSIHYLPSLEESADMSPLTTARRLDEVSCIFASQLFKMRCMNLVNELVGILALPFFFLLVFPDTLVDLVVDTPVFSSENLGDFASNGWMIEGVRGGRGDVELTASRVVSKDTEKVLSTIAFVELYGSNTSGLAPDQLMRVSQAEKFGNACKNIALQRGIENNFTVSFWYLLHRSVVDDTSGSVRSASIIHMSSDWIGVARDVLSPSDESKLQGA